MVPQFCEDSDGSEMHFNVQTEGAAGCPSAALEHWSTSILLLVAAHTSALVINHYRASSTIIPYVY